MEVTGNWFLFAAPREARMRFDQRAELRMFAIELAVIVHIVRHLWLLQQVTDLFQPVAQLVEFGKHRWFHGISGK